MQKYFLFILLSISYIVKGQRSFIHPGILHTKESLNRIKHIVNEKQQPGYGSFELLKNNTLSSFTYTMNGPYSTISRDAEFAWTKSKMEADFSSAYLNALMWVITNDERHAHKSIEILQRYSDSLKHIPPTNDAPLLVGLEGTKIINALELLKYTYQGMTTYHLTSISNLIKNVFLPVCEKFYSTPAYTNGNWGPIVTKFYISCAIYFNDEIMYNRSVQFYLHGRDNGTIENYIDSETGQIQESGRDQGHAQLGIGALATICEIVHNQGDDLYGALNNRLLKGFEYVAKYNLGNDVPFKKWKDVTAKYSSWETISPIQRGVFMPIYEMVYNHYVNRRGLKMPFTEQVIRKIRPEGYDRDQPGYGTLLFWESH